MAVTTREFLKEATWTRQMVDRWLDSSARSWSEYEPELGYRLRDSVVRDGVDSSFTISQYAPTGERRMVNFADRPCRINSYGDSFTQCAQVSDGETWQEYLAAHFGEPIRNYGVGGFGVYQAYRRMLREEATPLAAGNVIFNVWSDDHFRSIYPLRWLHSDIDSFRKQKDIPSYAVWPFGTPPWAHLRLDTATGEFQEHENPYSTPQSLYQLTDVDHVYETYKDDFDLQAYLAQQRVTDVNVAVLQRMADALEMSADFSSPDAIAATGHDLLQRCALRSSMYVLDKARQFIRAEPKRFLVLLSYSSQDVLNMCNGLPRFDGLFVDYLEDGGFEFFDGLLAHQEDFGTFRGTPEEYVARYYIGHYSPRGDHFFAFAAKDAIVNWLDPKPLTYLAEGEPTL